MIDKISYTEGKVRQIALRSFDREYADLIVDSMRKNGVEVLLETTIKDIELVKEADLDSLKPGQFKVNLNVSDSKTIELSPNSILVATGRYSTVEQAFDASKVDIKIDEKTRKVRSSFDMTTTPNIYALGDINNDKPELTPVAIAAGRKLINRLTVEGLENDYMNYNNVATTIFTYPEYSCVGMSEEKAYIEFGREGVDVYRCETFAPHLKMKKSKVIARRDTGNVVGLHFFGEEAGEIIQGFSMLMHKGLKIDSVLEHEDFIWFKNGQKENYESSPVSKQSKDLDSSQKQIFVIA
ncbi:MAG: Thioredoxin reductase 2, mitochondrial [Paramarteilia canceri]